MTTDDPAKGSHSSNRAIVPQGVPLRDDRQKVNLKHVRKIQIERKNVFAFCLFRFVIVYFSSSLVAFFSFSSIFILSLPRLISFFRERAQSRDGVGDTTRHKSSETLDVTVASTIRRIPRDNFGKRKMTMPYAANRQTSQKPMCFTLIRTFMIRLGAII